MVVFFLINSQTITKYSARIKSISGQLTPSPKVSKSFGYEYSDQYNTL